MPKSTDPLAAVKWRQENTATKDEYQKLLRLWRNQQFTEE
jgi:hypothetical protein